MRQKKIAIIGASYLQLPLVRKARKMNLHSICFAWDKDAVCKDEVDLFHPISITEKEAILSVCKEEMIDGICTIASDAAAPTVAYVAEVLGLIGNGYAAAVRANDKYQMRSAFKKGGIPCPRFASVASGESVDFRDWRFPLIVKPCDRSGSLGVRKVNDMTDLLQGISFAQAISFKKRAIVEEFIEGREISVEFISFEGKHYPLTITDKITTGPPHFVELEHHQPAALSDQQFEAIYDLTKKALSALGITNGASHTEYKITDDGRVFMIELGARMGGDFIGSDLVCLSTGYDFVKGVIQVALGDFEPPVLTAKKHSGVYFLCKETERLLPFFEQERTMPFFVCKELLNKNLKKVSCSSDRSGYMIYQANQRIVL